MLIAGTAFPALATVATTTNEAAGQPAPPEVRQEIIVTGQALFRDIRPEAELDEDGIASYGASTVDQLLSEVQQDLGEDDTPLILVNGERTNDLSEIGAFPVEALKNLQVLPRGSAVRMGGRSGQRVISLTLQRKMRAATLTAAPKIATDGGWRAGRGEALLTYLQGATRANVALRVRDAGSLLESERTIEEPTPSLPYSLAGNVIGFPGDEIDPALSTLAGHIITVAAIPGNSQPALADFVPLANQPSTTNVGQYRTLYPGERDYDFNSTANSRLAPWLTSNATLHFSRNSTHSLQGLPEALAVLQPDNLYSPFSTTVGLAYYGATPLHARSRREIGEGALTFNGTFGKWLSNLDLRHSESSDRFESERQATFTPIILDSGFNPFGSDLSSLIGIRTDRSTTKTFSSLGELSVTGPAFVLPAGQAQVTAEGHVSSSRLRSKSTFFTGGDRSFHRGEQGFRGAIDIPLTSRAADFGGAIGDFDATAEFTVTHFSDAGSLNGYAFGLTWQPLQALRLRGSIEQNEIPASIQLLGNPVVQSPDMRVFDPLTGQTVDVVQITGGNPGLRPARTKIRRLSGLLDLVPKLNLQLNAEYTDSDGRNYISSLPAASLAVMLAFPDRYVRNSDGVLTTVDLRPVNFDTHREKRLRWGFSMRSRLGGADKSRPNTSASSGSPRLLSGPSTYVDFTANHTIVFADRLEIRPGLDSVDLLGGGALGIGGGRVRHQIDASAAITSGGIGARAGVAWRGPSKLDTRIGAVDDTLHFSPVTMINLRLFADVARIVPHTAWAKSLRLSLDVVNLTNDRQRVRDSFGSTPLQYQPAYRDPLGRTIELEIRKVF
jgi:hypothetical protein